MAPRETFDDLETLLAAARRDDDVVPLPAGTVLAAPRQRPASWLNRSARPVRQARTGEASRVYIGSEIGRVPIHPREPVPEAMRVFIEANHRGHSFLSSIHNQMTTWSGLTTGQIAATQRIMDERANRHRQTAAGEILEHRVASQTLQNVGPLFAAIRAASATNRNARLRLGEYQFRMSPSRATIYIRNANGTRYIGKVYENGRVVNNGMPLSETEIDSLNAILAMPLMDAAVAYGRATGNCACCGRLLTDPDSVRRGIGPICIQTFNLGQTS